MTAPCSTALIDGQAGAPISIGSNAVPSPEQFAIACRQIVQRFEGDAAHRALDLLVTDLLNSLGYSEGMTIFLTHVAPYHDEAA